MPIRVEYGAPSLLLSLAAQAGEARGTLTKYQRGQQALATALQMRSMQQEERWRQEAFALQQAMAARTPTAAREVTTPMTASTMMQLAQQNAQLQYLDQMKATGMIAPELYEQNRLRILGGQAVQFPAEREAQMPLSTVMLPYTTKLQNLQAERQKAADWVADPTISSERKKQYEQLRADLDKQIAETVRQAQAVVAQSRGLTTGLQVPPTPEGESQTAEEGSTWKDTVTGKRYVIQNGKPVEF